MKQALGIIVLIFGVLSGLAFFYAGFHLGVASVEMSQLRSVDGKTVAEAYYQEAGKQGVAYSFALFASGLAIISVSVGLGANLLANPVPSNVLGRMGG